MVRSRPVKKCCSQCGQSIMQHRQSLTPALVGLLKKAFVFVKNIPTSQKEFHLQRDLSLTKNEYANFSKLHYWGFITNEHTATGYWRLTAEGMDFLNGHSTVPRHVFTFNNRVVERSNEWKTVAQIESGDGFKNRKQYAAEAKPLYT